MPPIRRKTIDVDYLSNSSTYKRKVKEESNDDAEKVRVRDGVEEVEIDVEPQDDDNGLSDFDESDFLQDVADASEDIEDIGNEEDIEEPPTNSGGEHEKVEPLSKVGDILGKTKDTVREEVLLPTAISRGYVTLFLRLLPLFILIPLQVHRRLAYPLSTSTSSKDNLYLQCPYTVKWRPETKGASGRGDVDKLGKRTTKHRKPGDKLADTEPEIVEEN